MLETHFLAYFLPPNHFTSHHSHCQAVYSPFPTIFLLWSVNVHLSYYMDELWCFFWTHSFLYILHNFNWPFCHFAWVIRSVLQPSQVQCSESLIPLPPCLPALDWLILLWIRLMSGCLFPGIQGWLPSRRCHFAGSKQPISSDPGNRSTREPLVISHWHFGCYSNKMVAWQVDGIGLLVSFNKKIVRYEQCLMAQGREIIQCNCLIFVIKPKK